MSKMIRSTDLELKYSIASSPLETEDGYTELIALQRRQTLSQLLHGGSKLSISLGKLLE